MSVETCTKFTDLSWRTSRASPWNDFALCYTGGAGLREREAVSRDPEAKAIARESWDGEQVDKI